MRKIYPDDFKQNYPILSSKYHYDQVAEMMWEYKTLKTLANNGSIEATHIFLLRIREIIYSTWSRNQYAMISDSFKNVFDSVFNDNQRDITYTDEWVKKLLTLNHFWELSSNKISKFIRKIEDNLYSQWIQIENIIDNNYWNQIAQNTDYTHE
jgi:hypothetical protein